MNTLKELRNIVLFINVFFLLLMIVQIYNLDSVIIHVSITDAIQFDIVTNVALMITSLVITLALTALSGIQVLGTGLNDEGVRTFIKAVSTIAVWFISSMGLYYNFSGINYIVINTTIIIFTVIYALGFAESVKE